MLSQLVCGLGGALLPAESQAACMISSMMSQLRLPGSQRVKLAGASCCDPGAWAHAEGAGSRVRLSQLQGETPSSPSCERRAPDGACRAARRRA